MTPEEFAKYSVGAKPAYDPNFADSLMSGQVQVPATLPPYNPANAPLVPTMQPAPVAANPAPTLAPASVPAPTTQTQVPASATQNVQLPSENAVRGAFDAFRAANKVSGIDVRSYIGSGYSGGGITSVVPSGQNAAFGRGEGTGGSVSGTSAGAMTGFNYQKPAAPMARPAIEAPDADHLKFLNPSNKATNWNEYNNDPARLKNIAAAAAKGDLAVKVKAFNDAHKGLYTMDEQGRVNKFQKPNEKAAASIVAATAPAGSKPAAAPVGNAAAPAAEKAAASSLYSNFKPVEAPDAQTAKTWSRIGDQFSKYLKETGGDAQAAREKLNADNEKRGKFTKLRGEDLTGGVNSAYFRKDNQDLINAFLAQRDAK